MHGHDAGTPGPSPFEARPSAEHLKGTVDERVRCDGYGTTAVASISTRALGSNNSLIPITAIAG
jgi:hypothetical protein